MSLYSGWSWLQSLTTKKNKMLKLISLFSLFVYALTNRKFTDLSLDTSKDAKFQELERTVKGSASEISRILGRKKASVDSESALVFLEGSATPSRWTERKVRLSTVFSCSY